MVQTGVPRVEGDVSLNLFLTTIKLQHIKTRDHTIY